LSVPLRIAMSSSASSALLRTLAGCAALGARKRRNQAHALRSSASLLASRLSGDVREKASSDDLATACLSASMMLSATAGGISAGVSHIGMRSSAASVVTATLMSGTCWPRAPAMVPTAGTASWRRRA
jgi:spore maturation protein SpmB